MLVIEYNLKRVKRMRRRMRRIADYKIVALLCSGFTSPQVSSVVRGMP
jgi:hypothetical protein